MNRLGIVLLLVAAMSTFGCALWEEDKWYKTGAYQTDFDRDSHECEEVVKSLVTDPHSGKMDLLEYITSYNSCLFFKGWGLTPPEAAVGPGEGQKVEGESLLADYQGDTVTAFGVSIEIPGDLTLVKREVQRVGPTTVENFFWQDPGKRAFINLLLQESGPLSFMKQPYPVQPPFFVYSPGKAEFKNLSYTVYSGEFRGSWVGGLGAYYMVNDRQRFILVVTTDLPQQSGPVPSNLRLTKEQHLAMKEFSAKWEPWVQAQFGKESAEGWSRYLGRLKKVFSLSRP